MDILIAFILFIFVLIYIYVRLKETKFKQIKLIYIALVVIHCASLCLNYFINLNIKKDSYNFYIKALQANEITDFNFLGSQFMSVLVYPFAKIGFSFFSISLLFSTLSLYTFYKYLNYLLKNLKVDNSNTLVFILILFLMPSLHFWTAGLTKEALVFYFMSIVFFQTLKKKILSFPFITSIVFILFIRPYLFGIILISYLAYVLLNIAITKKNKLILVALTLFAIIITLPILKKFLKVDNLNFEQIQKSFQRIITYSQNNGASSIDLENSTYFYRMFLVLFRPLFYDAKTVFQYLISIENLLTVVILIKFISNIIYEKAYKLIFKQKIFLSLTIILLILFFSIYLYNLGLASRMRVMFLPYLYLLMFSFYTEIEKRKKFNEA